MPDLGDRRVWDALLEPFNVARGQLLERAARERDDHAHALGKLEGLEHAMALLKYARAEFLKASGDPLP